MSLKGSLQTVALPEVLHLLADTGKSGKLHISGSRGEGRIWFEQGSLAGYDVGRTHEPSDALFELLRIDDGDFDFVSDEETPSEANRLEHGPGELAPALEVALSRLAEWTDIVAVVPSLQHQLVLRADAPGESVSMDRSQWQLVVAVGSGHPVGEVLDQLGLSEFEGCRAVRDLVSVALAEIGDPIEAAPTTSSLGASSLGGSNTGVAGLTVLAPFEVDPAFAVPDQWSYGTGATALETSESASDLSSEPASDLVNELVNDDQDAAGVESPGFESTEDHYSSLRAALSDIEASPEGPEAGAAQDGDAPAFAPDTYAWDTGESDGDHDFSDASDEGTEVDVDGIRSTHAESRAALHSLLAEVSAHAEPTDAGLTGVEPVDGLTDRGPWTHNELASLEQMGGWRHDDGGHDASGEVGDDAAAHDGAEGGAHDGTAAVESHEAGVGEDRAADDGAGEDEESQPGEEPINRGLLLKFLSSVRS